MHSSLPLLLSLLSTPLLSPATATPLHKRATTINCADSTTGLSPTCWLTLNMTSYMHNWANGGAATGNASIAHIDDKRKKNKKRAPAATTAATTAQVCGDDQSWSSCFMQQATGTSGADCSTVNATNCTKPIAGKAGVSVQMYYGAYNIYGKDTFPQSSFPRSISL